MSRLNWACVVAGAVAIFGAAGSPATAAVIGPDAFGYTATNEIAFSFTDISGTATDFFGGADDTATSVPIGFAFNFYGVSFTTASFSTNGLVTFGAGNTQYSNVDLTTSSPDANVPTIAALWDDWIGAEGVYAQTVGPVGSQQFIVQWNLTSRYGGSPSTVTFQSVLSEGSNDIRFNYLDVDAGNFSSFGGNATIGIRNTNGQNTGENLQWLFNGSPRTVANGESILFSVNQAPVPEPVSLAIWGIGAAAVAAVGLARRRRKA